MIDQVVADALEADYTVDAFHRGDFFLVQLRARGHRAGMDSMVLAAAVPSGFDGAVADFGSGAGAAGLAVASRCPAATVTLVERSPDMVHCAMRSLALPANARLASRVAVLPADVALRGKERTAAGLAERSFDFVVMNPPFNASGDRRSPDALRSEAHVMDGAVLEDWIRSAAAVLRPGGRIAAIVRPDSLGPLLSALAGRFGAVQIMPVHPREGAAAIRVVARAVRGSRAAPALLPPLYLHEPGSDRFGAHADLINNGRATLFAD
ncbi:MAG: tRNA1(Val) (adenine(37)-N6)-methyltransferase [Rhizobiaceae bacterium]